MKTAIEKPMTPGGVFDHLMVPQGDEPEFHPSKDPKTMTVQESLEEVDRFLCWNRMTPEEKRAEQEAQRAASHATEQAAGGDLYTMEPERKPDTPQDTVWEDLTDAPQDIVRADVPNAADVVRSIYRRKLEGMSAKVIAEQLNSEGVLAPSEYKRLCGLNYHSGFKAGTHAKWQAIQVLRILKNEVYTGTMVQGKRQKINYKIKKIRDVEESGWIKVPNMHEAIIPQKLFDTVQEVLKLDTCASKGQQTVNLFSGMVRCGGCGQNMVRRTVSKNGKKYVYLHCITNHNGLGCSSHLISESKLAEVVLAALQGKIQQISGLEQRLDEINEIPKNQRRLKSVEEHMKMLEQEEQKYQTLRRQLYEDMSSGIVSKDEYKEFSRSFNEKVENICKAKTEMNRQLDSLSNLDVEHLPWIEDFKSYQNLTSLNRRVLVELVESITVYDKEHIHIQYRFDQEIRNVLEYCNSVPTTETEGSTV